jgi:pimeloyl-ACP methyl ester carboxylesterase
LHDGGRSTVYDLSGPRRAPTVVLLHGWGGTAATNWATAMGTLAVRFRVVAPDLRGHDLSAVDDVVAIADAVGVERFIPVGYSLGGAVASQLWRHHPDRVDGLVFCAAAGVVVPARDRTGSDREVPTAVVVTRQDRLVSPESQLQVARSYPGATVHPVNGNHFAFADYGQFVPVLVGACRSVARRAATGPSPG